MTPSVEKERVSNYDPNKKNYVRQHDPERVARNRKQLARENSFMKLYFILAWCFPVVKRYHNR